MTVTGSSFNDLAASLRMCDRSTLVTSFADCAAHDAATVTVSARVPWNTASASYFTSVKSDESTPWDQGDLCRFLFGLKRLGGKRTSLRTICYHVQHYILFQEAKIAIISCDSFRPLMPPMYQSFPFRLAITTYLPGCRQRDDFRPR